MGSCPSDAENDANSDFLYEIEDSCPQHAENDPDQDGTCDPTMDSSLSRLSPYLSEVELIVVVAVSPLIFAVIIIIIVIVCVEQRGPVNAQNVNRPQQMADTGVEMQESPARSRLYVTTTAAEGSIFNEGYDGEFANSPTARRHHFPLSIESRRRNDALQRGVWHQGRAPLQQKVGSVAMPQAKAPRV